MIRTSSTHQLGSLQSNTARLFARWHRAHSAWSDSEDAAAAWRVGRYLADQPSGGDEVLPLHAHLACLAVFASGDGVTFAAHTPCHFR